MAIANLQAIITKTRKLTASANSLQITDADIIDYINSFYLYDFPAEFRSLDLKDVYTFNTTRGIDTYPFDRDHWINIQEPCYIAKREVRLFQDPLQFYYFNFNSSGHWQREENITTGTAALGVGPYTGTLQATPIIRSVNNNPAVQTTLSNTAVQGIGNFPPSFVSATNLSGSAIINRVQNFLITAQDTAGNTMNVTDDGAGNLINAAGTASGTVNYVTGAISVTFSASVEVGGNITAFYNPVVLNAPLAILFWQDQVFLRPVPDKGYTVEIVGYRTPSQALLGTTTTTNMLGRPELLEWWETLAVGAAKKIYEDRLDMDGVSMMDKMLQERYQQNFTRTYANLGKRRIGTIYSDQLEYTYGNGPYGIGNFS